MNMLFKHVLIHFGKGVVFNYEPFDTR